MTRNVIISLVKCHGTEPDVIDVVLFVVVLFVVVILFVVVVLFVKVCYYKSCRILM